jgi:hypothetical protein
MKVAVNQKLVDAIRWLTKRNFEVAVNRGLLIRILAELIDTELYAMYEGAYDSARKPKPRTDGAVQISDGGRNAFEGRDRPGSRS